MLKPIGERDESEYRRREKLLDRAIATAHEQKFTLIFGNVTADDLAESPFLLEWYQQKGFKITEPFESFAIHGIKMELSH